MPPRDPFEVFGSFGSNAKQRLRLTYPRVDDAALMVAFRKELLSNKTTKGYFCDVLGRDGIAGSCIGGCTHVFKGTAGSYHAWKHFTSDDPTQRSKHEATAWAQAAVPLDRTLTAFFGATSSSGDRGARTEDEQPHVDCEGSDQGGSGVDSGDTDASVRHSPVDASAVVVQRQCKGFVPRQLVGRFMIQYP